MRISRREIDMSLVKELRSKQSRDNRELLDRAADRIEELEKAKYICRECREGSNWKWRGEE